MSKNNFISDNCSASSREVLDYLIKVNTGKAAAYGYDSWSHTAIELMKQHFNKNIDIHFVCNGTAANTLAIKTLLKPHHTIICANCAHLYENECGAIEAISGNKILPVQTKYGKISPLSIAPSLSGLGCLYATQPKLISITQATELGTVYSLNELNQIKAYAKKNNLLLHLDGARLANAAVFLRCNLNEICEGFDVFSFGCSKNGSLFGDALIFSNKNFLNDFRFLQKQNLQLTPKTRYIAAQFIAMFENNLWETNARNANAMALELSNKLAQLNEVSILYPTEINLVFAKLPPDIITSLLKFNEFSIVNPQEGIIRLATSFDTTESDINNFVSSLKKVLIHYD